MAHATDTQRIQQLLEDLTRAQDALTATQRELLGAITRDQPGVDSLHFSVRAQGKVVMAILANLQSALRDASGRQGAANQE